MTYKYRIESIVFLGSEIFCAFPLYVTKNNDDVFTDSSLRNASYVIYAHFLRSVLAKKTIFLGRWVVLNSKIGIR